MQEIKSEESDHEDRCPKCHGVLKGDEIITVTPDGCKYCRKPVEDTFKSKN